MITFKPRSRFPLPVKFLLGAGCVAAVTGPLVHLARHGGWNSSEWATYFCGICLMAALVWLLVKEVSRQMHVTISAQGVVVGLWRLGEKWPYLMLRETSIPWDSVRKLSRAGFTLIFETRHGKRSVNLILFENSQQVEQFAFNEWRAHVNDARAAV